MAKRSSSPRERRAFQDGHASGVAYGMRRVEGFMCKTDFDNELGIAAGGIPVYASEADLRRHRSCVRECGIVKVQVQLLEIVAPDSYL